MGSINLRESLNALSDVVANRPTPLRQFDQIHMKTADMLMQIEHVAEWFDGRRTVFIGDGDAIGLAMVYLKHKGLIQHGPETVHILDFDERIVYSVQCFAEQASISTITAELYNIADPLPEHNWQEFDAFYTNPPFGASNKGASVLAFLTRGFEATGKRAVGCLVLADDPDRPWTQEVIQAAERFVLENGFIISAMLPRFHQYHLDDAPDLRSCSMIVTRLEDPSAEYSSKSLPSENFRDFYGKGKPLEVRYVRRLEVTEDHTFECFTNCERG